MKTRNHLERGADVNRQVKVVPAQTVNATPACSLLAGVSNPTVFLGVDSSGARLGRAALERWGTKLTHMFRLRQGFAGSGEGFDMLRNSHKEYIPAWGSPCRSACT
jgi:hypothetical protein